MAKLTIEKARHILGKLADNLTDEEIERDLKVAETLKNLFFQSYVSVAKPSNIYNKNTNAKT